MIATAVISRSSAYYEHSKRIGTQAATMVRRHSIESPSPFGNIPGERNK